MEDMLTDRVAVVTGGASGIGRATVLRFLAAGARVVVGDLNADNGRATRRRGRRRQTGCASCAPTSPTRTPSRSWSPQRSRRFGGLDVMFNNAGVGGAFGPITEISVTDWDRTFAVLMRSVFLGIKHGARVMIDQGRGGSIINTASVAGLGGGGGPQAYSAAKAAVVNLTSPRRSSWPPTASGSTPSARA